MLAVPFQADSEEEKKDNEDIIAINFLIRFIDLLDRMESSFLILF